MVNTYCCNIIVYSRARGLRLRVWNLNRNLLHRPRDFQLRFFHVSSSFHVVFVLLCFVFFTFCMEPAPIECAKPAPKSVGGKMLSIVRAATLPIIQFLFKPRNESELLLLFIEISNYASLAHLYRFCVEDFSCKITMRKIDWLFQWCATEKNLSPTLHLHRTLFPTIHLCHPTMTTTKNHLNCSLTRPLIYKHFFFTKIRDDGIPPPSSSNVRCRYFSDEWILILIEAEFLKP